MGYNLEDICASTVTFWQAEEKACSGKIYCPPLPPNAPPPPRYSRAGPPTPRGCSHITPLPTLLQSVDFEYTFVWCFLIIYLFYGLAMVCEEFLVPAINIVCEKTGIPDDVAGATLLAAGCNSPEFFASVIGIFVADSTVGVGTVIGSTPFNLNCITAGAALCVTGGLVLDPWLMGRELIGLFIAMVLFLIFMDDYLIEWHEALIMVVYYCFIYVPVLANFSRIKSYLLRLLLGSKMRLDEDTLGMTPALEMRSTDQSVRSTRNPFGGLRSSLASSLSNSLAEEFRMGFDVQEVKQSQMGMTVPEELHNHPQIELRPIIGTQRPVEASPKNVSFDPGLDRVSSCIRTALASQEHAPRRTRATGRVRARAQGRPFASARAGAQDTARDAC